MKRMYQSKMYQVNGTSALATQRPSFRVINGDIHSKKSTMQTSQCLENKVVEKLSQHEVFVLSLFVSVALVISFVASFIHSNAINSYASSVMDSASHAITVHSNDTLWSIAENNPIKGVSIEQQVDWIKLRNNLNSSNLQIGQVLEIPAATK